MEQAPQGMIPRPEVRIYLASEKCFYLSEEINNTIQNTLADLGEEVTIEKVYEFIVGVFGSSKDLVSTDKIFIQGGKHPSLPSFRMLKKIG